MRELEAILRRAGEGPLSAEDRRKLQAAIETLGWLQGEISRKNASLERLRKLLFGTSTTEKTKGIIESLGKKSSDGERPTPDDEDAEDDPAGSKPARKRPGHGKRAASGYPGAKQVEVAHPEHRPGDPCPEKGCRGRLYRMPQPALIVCLRGQPPIEATVHRCERLRCALCGRIFTAPLPEGVRNRKYDETAASMVGFLKYGSGMPFYRIEGLQRGLGIPLAAATQWELVRDAAKNLAPAFEELLAEAAQGDVLYNDDTGMTILAHLKENRRRRKEKADGGKKERTGTFTSGIVSEKGSRKIGIFRTGRRHAGENLTEVLARRRQSLPAPIQMCDALKQNLPKEFKTILANCLGHGRRKFVDVVDAFPEECRFVLETLRDVYRNDAHARRVGMNGDERLRHHQKHSKPLMRKLRRWMKEAVEDRRVEPNSALGEAIAYMTKRWEELTLFLRKPGAPLDNNVCERALKKAILHRKNALFFKTENGAEVGDTFLSLIYSAELAGENPVEYLTALLRHARDVRTRPGAWMPWNFLQTLATLA